MKVLNYPAAEDKYTENHSLGLETLVRIHQSGGINGELVQMHRWHVRRRKRSETTERLVKKNSNKTGNDETTPRQRHNLTELCKKKTNKIKNQTDGIRVFVFV